MWQVAQEQHPAAQRQQFVEAVVANGFHHRQTVLDVDFARFAFAIGDDQLGHGLSFSCRLKGCARGPRAVRETRGLLGEFWAGGKLGDLRVGEVRWG